MKRECAQVAAALALAATAHARVLLGVDNLVAHERQLVVGKRIGIVTNQTGVTGDGRRTIDALAALPRVTIAAIFTPEHGLNGTAAAGARVASGVDSATRAPVISLYGALRKPRGEMLAGLDAVVYDIQDIGVRSYTFISTLGLVMEAAAAAHVRMIVLDRPGLLADRVDGNILDTAYRSFVGKYPIPYVYGMTVGELAAMINGDGMIAGTCALTVVPMVGWTRSMPWDSLGLPWRPTSPNIPEPSTAAYCAAFGAVGELGAGYQGIGSPDAFRVFGGRAFPAVAFDSMFTMLHLNGVRVTTGDTAIVTKTGAVLPISYVRFVIDPRRAQDLFAVGLHVIALLHAAHLLKTPDRAHIAMFNKVCGADLYTPLMAGMSVDSLVAGWRGAREKFLLRRAKYLRSR